MVRAARREAEELAPFEHGADQRDVRQVGAAAVGVVEDPEVAVVVLLADDRGDGVRHRAEVHRDVLGLHDELAARVEERRRAVVALGDVGRVGRADQDRAHLVTGGAQGAGHHLEGYRVEAAHFVLSAVIVPA